MNKELNQWVSVKENSIATILKEKGLHKKMYSCAIKILLRSGVLEKRGATSSTEYKILRKPTDLNDIAQQILNDYSSSRNKEYVFGKEKLELGKKYYMVFKTKIFEVQIIGIKISKSKEILYDVKKQKNSTNSMIVLKNIKYKDVYLTITSAGDQVKNNAINECKFIV